MTLAESRINSKELAEQFVDEAKLNAHIERYSMPNTILTQVFKAIASKNLHFKIEPSIKVTQGRVDAGRINIWFDNRTQFKEILQIIREQFTALGEFYGFQPDWSRIDALHPQVFSLLEAEQLAIGFDERSKTEQSRLKFYFNLPTRNPLKVLQILEALKIDAAPIKPFIEHCRLFGFDFLFDGTSRIKLYPAFRTDEFEKLKDLIPPSPIANNLLSESHRCFVSMTDDAIRVHFGTTGKAIRNHIDQRQIAATLNDKDRYIFGINAGSSSNTSTNNFNLYYWSGETDKLFKAK